MKTLGWHFWIKTTFNNEENIGENTLKDKDDIQKKRFKTKDDI